MSSRIVSLTRTPEEELRSRLHVHLEQDGGNPSQLLEMLDLAVSKAIWDEFGLTFRQFVELPYEGGGLGWSIDNLKSVLKLRHRYEHEGSGHPELSERIGAMRRRVTDLLSAPLNPNGGNRKSVLHCQTDTPAIEGGNSASYTTRRLKRDRPDLARKVIDGELTANAAAIEAGFRSPKFQLPSDPAAAARYLAQRVDDAWWAAFDAEREVTP